MFGSRLIIIASIVLIIAIPIIVFAARSNPRVPNLSPEQTMAQYWTEASTLTLAPGWVWPVSPVPNSAPDGNAVMYEDGWGKQAANVYWFCSWVSLMVDPQVSAVERQQALEHVLSIRTTYFYTNSLSAESKPGFNQMLQNAEAGNVQELRRYYEANCQKNP